MRRAPRHFVAIFVLLCGSLGLAALAPLATAAPGDLDPTFGSGGVVTNSLGSGVDVVTQADGKLVTVGTTKPNCTGSGETYVCHSEFLVERYNESGSLDTSFGDGDGIVTTSLGHNTQEASSVIIESSGKILVGGKTEGEFALARYNSDGSLDSSFGEGDGKATATVPDTSGLQSSSSSMALQTGGKIVLGGSAYTDESQFEPWHMVLARFTTSGVLDTSYGPNGTVIGPAGQIYGLTVDANDRALAAGWSNFEFAAARFNSDGGLDTSFAGAGIVRMDLSAVGSKATDVLVQPDGGILVSGYGIGMTVARFNENGSLDPTFGGGDGITTPTFSPPCCVIGSAIALALQPDGRIVIAGQWRPTEFKDEWAVARLYPNGAPDKNFGVGGLVTNAFEGAAYEDYATGVTLQADGKIVAIGTSGYPDYDSGTLRFLGGGSAPQPAYHRITVSNSDPANGHVTAPDLTCGFNCAADYEVGETVEIRASPEYESTFTGWSTTSGNPGTCTGTTTPCEATLNGNVELVATFEAGSPVNQELTISKTGTGTGSVTSSPAGIACGATCSAEFGDGTAVTLTAIPALGSSFTGWSGGACSGTVMTCEVTMSGNKTVGASFAFSESGGSSGGSSQSPALPATVIPPPPSITVPVTPKAPLKCRKGFKKQKVHGKVKCVKIRKKRRS